MSYANLNIVINTNAAQAAQSMSSFGIDAKQALNGAQSDVERFRQSMADTAAANEAAAHRFQASMTAANDAVIGKTQETKKAMEDVAKATDNINPKGFTEKIAAAFGSAFGAGYAATETWLQKTEDFVVAKGKAIAIGLAIAAVSAAAATVYTAYRVITEAYGFIEGLFTGDSMKSKSIDALIAINVQVKDLQTQLVISATEAGALLDALGRLGVDKSGYVETYKNAATAMHTNTDELDRLGVKYKDTNGQLLTQAQFLTNVKIKLDEYRDGYDRTAAAAAIGAGSYDKVVDALKITDAQIQQSKDRLDDYNLGIGPQTQVAVARYQQAMRDFYSESQKTSEGFSRVIADSFMPMATALAEWLKNGFPSAVAVFRGVTAFLSTAVYGLATSIGMAYELVSGGATALVEVVSGVIIATGKAMSGDFSGAKVAMADWLDAAKKRMEITGQSMVDIAVANNKNIKAAWAMDDRSQSLDAARTAATQQAAGKDWVPAPKPEKEVSNDPNRAPFTRYMEELERMNVKLDQNEYAMMRVKAAQEAVRQKGLDLASAMDQANAAIDRIQRTESQRAVDIFTNKLKLENEAYAQQSDLIGLNTAQQEIAAVAIKRRMEAENAINEAKRSGKPLDDQAIADLRANTEEQIKNMQALVAARQAMQRTGEFGQNKAFQEYADNASNQALQVKTAWGNAFRGMEDALVQFMTTSKINFASLANSIISDLIRIQVQRSITGPLANAMMGSGFSGWTANLFGGARAAGGPVDGGATYLVGENGPELFTPGVSGGITPNSALGSNVVINIKNEGAADGYQANATASSNGGQMNIEVMFSRAMRSDVRSNGPMTQALSQAFGLQRRAM